MSSKDDLVVIGFKLEVVVLKVGSVLYKEPLEGFLVSLIGAGLVYFKSLGLLEYIEMYNLLLELANLITYFFNRVSLGLDNLESSKSLRYHYILILYS
jgi:hypothetical protein